MHYMKKVFAFSGFSGYDMRKRELNKKIEALKGSCYDGESLPQSCTCLICMKPSRSEKFLGACIRGLWIVVPQYIDDSFEARRWLAETDYEWAPQYQKGSLGELPDCLFLAPQRRRTQAEKGEVCLFSGWKVFLIIKDRKKCEGYKRLLKSGGAHVLQAVLLDNIACIDGVTHAFVDQCDHHSLPLLQRAGIPCISPDYIRHYILSDPSPEPEQFLISVYNHDFGSLNSSGSSPLVSIIANGADGSKIPFSIQVGTNMRQSDKLVCRENNMKHGNIWSTVLSNRRYNGFTSCCTTPCDASDRGATHGMSPENLPPCEMGRKSSKVMCNNDSSSYNCQKVASSKNSLGSGRNLNSPHHITPQKSLHSYFSSPRSGNCPTKQLVAKRCLLPGNSSGTSTNDAFKPRDTLPKINQQLVKSMLSNKTLNGSSTSLRHQPDPCQLETTMHVHPTSGTASVAEVTSSQKIPISPVETNGHSPVGARLGFLSSPEVRKRKGRSLFSGPPPKNQRVINAYFSPERKYPTQSETDGSQLQGKESPLTLPVYGSYTRSFQPYSCRGGEVGKEMSSYVTSVFDASAEEGAWAKGLEWLQSVLSPRAYPEERILGTILQKVFKSKKYLSVAHHIRKFLQSLLLFHPPTTYCMSRYYYRVLCFASPDERSPWAALSTVIEKAMHDISSRTNSSCSSLTERNRMLLQFWVQVLEADFSAFLKRSVTPSQDLQSRNERPLVAKVFWPAGTVGSVNTSCRELADFVAASVPDNAASSIEMELLLLLQRIVAMVSQCCCLPDIRMRGLPQCQSLQCDRWAKEFVVALKEHGITSKPDSLKTFLGTTQIPWLRMKASALLLCSDFVLQNPTLLSLRQIVSHFMIRIPMELTGTDPREWRTEGRDRWEPDQRAKTSYCNEDDETRRPVPVPKKQLIINKRNMKGETHLHLACMRGDVEKVQRLLAIPGVDVNARDHFGWTPLHEACNHGSVDCVKSLLEWKPPLGFGEKPVDLQAMSLNRITPLHDAVYNDHLAIAKLLLEHGGKHLLQTPNLKGKTPLDICRSAAMRKVLTSELDHCTTVMSIQCDRLQTPIDFFLFQKLKDSMKQRQRSFSGSYPFIVSEDFCIQYVLLLWHLVSSYLKVHHTAERISVLLETAHHRRVGGDTVRTAQQSWLPDMVNRCLNCETTIEEQVALADDLYVAINLPRYLAAFEKCFVWMSAGKKIEACEGILWQLRTIKMLLFSDMHL